MMSQAAVCLALTSLAAFAAPKKQPDPYLLFERPGNMIHLSNGNSLSLYCSGSGAPTVVLETGFRGGTYASWYRLQPLLSQRHRTCSYDRAGYGFSQLGNNLPRDLNHQVNDLHEMLQKSGEKAPYILVGHSNGGLVIGAFADRYPAEVAGLVFLDAAVVLKRLPVEPSVGQDAPHPNPYLEADLDHIRKCEQLANDHNLAELESAPTNCIDPKSFDQLPLPMAQAEISNETRPSYWRALLSESDSNYRDEIGGQAMALLPHHWLNIPIRVITAAIPSMDDHKAAQLFGIPENDKPGLNKARQNRKQWEKRQAEVCKYARNCQVRAIATFEHAVQNANPAAVAEAVEEIATLAR